MKIFWKN